MPKGKYNHKGKSNTTAIIENAKAYGAEIQSYKEYAAQRNKNRRYDIYEITRVINNIVDYITSCINSGRPATIAKIILYSGSNKDFFYKAKSGDYDYITEMYIAENDIDLSQCACNEYGLLIYTDKLTNDKIVLSHCSEVIEKCLLLIEDDLIIRSLTDKSMARTTGAIFNLKSVFNYNDKPETEPKSVHNTLIVNANAEQTAKAMQLLLDNK